MLVYTYGCKAPRDEARALEILRAANRYRNQLVELRQAEAACFAFARLAQSPEYRDVIDDNVINAHAAAYALSLALPVVAHAQALIETAERRRASDLHYGTYLLIEKDVAKAKRFKRFDGCGRLGAPLPTSKKRTLAADVTAGTDSNIQFGDRVDGAPNWRHARLRVGRDEWVDFRVRLHRPLPANTIVAQAWLKRTAIGTHARWELQLVLLTDRAPIARTPTGRWGGLDIGWRYVDPDAGEGDRPLRVACDSDGASYELPAQLVGSVRHARSIEGIRARAFNEHKPHPAMKSSNRLAARVRTGEFPTLEAWRKQDRHLHDWHEFQEDRARRRRKALYQQYARELCAKFDVIVIEDFDLSRVARRAKRDEHASEQERLAEDKARARSQRFDAAPGLFRAILREVARIRGVRIVEVSAVRSNACIVCGWWNKDKSGRLVVRCPQCERRYDGDQNAAENLRRRGLEKEALADGYATP